MKQVEWFSKRKSVRKYTNKILDTKLLDIIEKEFTILDSVISNTQYGISLIRDGGGIKEFLKGMVSKYTHVKAPHYILLTSKNTKNDKLNLGFIGEQVVKSLTNNGLGACWIGAKKDLDKLRDITQISESHDFSILIAFGEPINKLEVVSTRKRKSFDEIFPNNSSLSETKKNICEAVLTAPSSINNQPWRFKVEKDELIFFAEHPKGLMGGMIKDLIHLECGIGLFHVFESAKVNNYNVIFEKMDVDDVNLGKISFAKKV